MKKSGNAVKLVLFTVLLGCFAGLVVWCFLKAVAVSTHLVWDVLPKSFGNPYVIVAACTAGGLVVGILHKLFGDYPEELSVVMGKIKKEKHYDYHPMAIMLICAFIPLVFGASVGPEAGLTGIIAALCYWMADNVTYAKQDTVLYSQIGEAVTLGQLFHSPLFGIFAVEESETEGNPEALSKGNKLVFYGIATAASFLVAEALNAAFGAPMEGFPSFAELKMCKEDFLMLLIYIPVGLLLYLLFELSEKLTALAGRMIPVILKETLCGAVIGLMGIMVPIAMFSGEEQMGELMETFVSYSPVFLIGICLLKMIMTTFCINLGMKGGHFFPLIFACTCMGFAVASLVFSAGAPEHTAFAAAAICATVLGAQLKKPIAASLLLLLCFPVRALFCIFLCAVIGKSAAGKITSVFADKRQTE